MPFVAECRAPLEAKRRNVSKAYEHILILT